MDSTNLLAVLVNFLFTISIALKCKCTQSSKTAECVNGVCDILFQSAACLMLNHSRTGIHYACSSNNLPDGLCQERKTKTNATVNICSCRNANYCNYSSWPDDAVQKKKEDNTAKSSMQRSRNSASKQIDSFKFFAKFSVSVIAVFFLI